MVWLIKLLISQAITPSRDKYKIRIGRRNLERGARVVKSKGSANWHIPGADRHIMGFAVEQRIFNGVTLSVPSCGDGDQL